MRTRPLDPSLCTHELALHVMSRCEVSADGCWTWTGARILTGYGRVKVPGHVVCYTHRVMWVWANGRDPGELTIDHLCRNTSCCNPEHLEAVTMRVNLLRGDSASARHAKKSHCPSGHKYSSENTYLYRGSRHCKACTLRRTREQYRLKHVS